MAEYKVFLKESVQKDLEGIPKNDLRKIMARIKLLANDPRPLGYEKLSGLDRYRLRQERYCIVYGVQDEKHAVTVVKVGQRSMVNGEQAS